ncbi:MAG: branched-chain amino acid transporter permease [Aristaeellaceae bacterium]
MTTTQLLLTVLIAAAVTILLRTAPFLLFPAGKQAPAFITWLGNQLPRAVMMMLLVYCLKDIQLTGAPYGLPALLGVAATAALHVWKRQMILSIAGGTAIYMMLIRLMGM